MRDSSHGPRPGVSDPGLNRPTHGTLDTLRPRIPLWRRLTNLVLLVACLATLVASYRETSIDPGLLWSNRGKAAEFLFGRSIPERDRADARAQAERFPEMLATERARSDMRREATASGESLPREPELSKLIKARANGILAAESAQERSTIVESEYRHALSSLRGGFFPPESRPDKVGTYLRSLLETLAIAVWGTLLAVVCAVPFALLAARSTLEILAPGQSAWHKSLRWLSRFFVRRFLDACRGFNEFVLALIIVAVIGLGPFTGVLALFIHSTGVLGKVFSEAIDAMEPGPVEGVTSTGAKPLHVISYAVLPQIMPYLVSNSLLRFETNVRSATILGVVGAGGIGFLMSDKINGYQYREVCTMMIIVIIAVTLIDLLCTRLMRAVV
jgi:phosphonate transport system permease protein